jgi:hypothetical protein
MFSITSLNVWFWFIFMSDFVLILLIAIFCFKSYFISFFFQFHHLIFFYWVLGSWRRSWISNINRGWLHSSFFLSSFQFFSNFIIFPVYRVISIICPWSQG